ncbi:MAG: hypothetical protein AB7P03_29145 [Kofleriaceae bacterium]
MRKWSLTPSLAELTFALKIIPRFVRHEWLGLLEMHVCRRCHLMQWNVQSLDGVNPDASIKELEAPEETPPAGGPYR